MSSGQEKFWGDGGVRHNWIMVPECFFTQNSPRSSSTSQKSAVEKYGWRIWIEGHLGPKIKKKNDNKLTQNYNQSMVIILRLQTLRKENFNSIFKDMYSVCTTWQLRRANDISSPWLLTFSTLLCSSSGGLSTHWTIQSPHKLPGDFSKTHPPRQHLCCLCFVCLSSPVGYN